jgi:phage gp36-like protein
VPYATNTDLLAEFPALTAFPSSGKVTAASVDEWCTRASNFIDAKIGGKYSTPVDSTASPKSFSLLKEICCWLVYPRVAGVLNLPTGDAKTSTGTKTVDFNAKADAALKEIQSGTMKLNDAVLATAADGVESYTNDHASTLQPPTFTRSGDDW